MPRPDASPIAERAWGDLGPWARADALTEDWDLLRLVEAALGDLQLVEDLVRDTDEVDGWGAIMDVDLAPDQYLDYLAQFPGVRGRTYALADDKRAAIRAKPTTRRGTPAALVEAAQATLTDTKTVKLFERYTGNAYRVHVQTITSETPDAPATLAALLAAKPGGLILTHAAVAGRTYLDVAAEFADYTALEAEGTYADVRDG